MLIAVLNGQSALKTELLTEIRKVDSRSLGLEKEMREGFSKITESLDRQGAQLAYLEDDTPTRKELDKLEKRVQKVERQLASV